MATEYKCMEFTEGYGRESFSPFEVMKGDSKSRISTDMRNSVKKEIFNVFTGQDPKLWIEMIRIDENGKLFVEFNADHNLPLEDINIVLPFSISEWYGKKKIRRSTISDTYYGFKIETLYKRGKWWKKLDIRTIKTQIPDIAAVN